MTEVAFLAILLSLLAILLIGVYLASKAHLRYLRAVEKQIDFLIEQEKETLAMIAESLDRMMKPEDEEE